MSEEHSMVTERDKALRADLNAQANRDDDFRRYEAAKPDTDARDAPASHDRQDTEADEATTFMGLAPEVRQAMWKVAMTPPASLTERIWTCKIGGKVGELPKAADWPMRVAVNAAFRQITGADAEFCFSGWGGSLSAGERAVVNDDDDAALDALTKETPHG